MTNSGHLLSAERSGSKAPQHLISVQLVEGLKAATHSWRYRVAVFASWANKQI